MRKGIIYSFVVMGLIFTNGCVKDPNSIENLDTIDFLTSEQLTELYTGRTTSGKHHKFQKHYKITYKADGTYAGTVADGAKAVSGIWKIKENGKICGGLNTEDRCWQVYQDQDKFYTVNNGKSTTTFTVK